MVERHRTHWMIALLDAVDLMSLDPRGNQSIYETRFLVVGCEQSKGSGLTSGASVPFSSPI